MHTWHITPTFTVTADELPVRYVDGGPVFDADSAVALTVLGPTVGPTATLTLRTMSLVGRAGPRTWHLADLASMHGVGNNVMRHALDRLVRFHWLSETGPGQVTLRRTGNLSQRAIDRLHPAIADHYSVQADGAPHAVRPSPPAPRYPLAPLLAKAGAEGISQFARMIDVNRSTIQAAATRGLSELNADRFAIAAGLHPAEVWPEFIEVMPS